jgi:RNA polymerase sigma-70 factor (ECF subfamily)
MVNGLAFRLLGSDTELDDVVQESFAQALESLPRLSATASFRAWLISLVCRTCYKLLRRRRVLWRLGIRGEAVDLDLVISSDAPPDLMAELREIYRRIDELPTPLRIALVLRRVEGLSVEETAEAIGSSAATVKRRVAEAERLLGRSK